MFISRRSVFITISLVIGLVIAIILGYKYVSLLSPKTVVPTNTTNTANQVNTLGGGQTVTTNTNQPVMPTLSPEEQDKLYVKQLAGIFTERFATYSNQNDGANIIGVKSLVSAEMSQWLDSQIGPNEAVYHGVTTNVIASRIDSYTTETAIVKLDTRRLVEDKITGTITENKSATVNLVKTGEGWKVSGFFWD